MAWYWILIAVAVVWLVVAAILCWLIVRPESDDFPWNDLTGTDLFWVSVWPAALIVFITRHLLRDS